MKKLTLLAFGLVLMLFTTSCNFTENITVNADGSGKMLLAMDGSQLIALTGGQLGNKKVDSVFTFKKLLLEKKDSIAKLPKAQQDKLKALENISIKTLLDPENSVLTVDVLNDFKKANEIQDVMQAFTEIAKMQNPGKAEGMGMLNNNSTVKYTYDGKKFKKTIEVLPAVKQDDAMSMYKSMLEGSSYKVNYTFPKKIKSVSNKSAVIGADKKTLTVSYPLLDYLDNPASLGLDVEFEK